MAAIVRSDDLEWAVISNHRRTTIEFKRMFQGEHDAPENFEMSLVKMKEHYWTPAHHHNFEQVRLALKGGMGFGPGRTQAEGSVGYFPEGAFYEQDAPPGQVTMVLQCGGASGSGFLSYDQLREGAASLSREGRFDDGIYVGPKGDNRTGKDGYEAVWEHVRGRELVYPEPRQSDHLIMNPEAYIWRTSGIEGVSVRHLVTVTERRLALEFYRFEKGGPREFGPVAHRTLLFVTAGDGRIDGEPVTLHDAIQLKPGETMKVDAGTSLEMFVMTMPAIPPEAVILNKEPEEDENRNAA